MPSSEALRLAAEVGCLPTEASAVLQAEPEYGRAKLAVQSILAARRRLYLQRLQATWADFAQPSDARQLGLDETIAFLQQLGLPLEDPLLLAVAYELQAPRIGVLEYDHFIDGWARLEAGDLTDMRTVAIPALAKRMESDFGYFREIYRFTFRLNLSEGARLLDRETAAAYWELLLAARYPESVKRWLEFYTSNKGVSSDTWNMFLEFCVYATKDPTLADYDDTSAWPAVIDEFVEFLKQGDS